MIDYDEDLAAYMSNDSEPCETDICPACNGSGDGQHEDTRCYLCKGKGEV